MHPFQLIPQRHRRVAIITTLLATAILGTGMLALNSSLESAKAPRGIWDLELARTHGRAQAILDSWSPPAAFAERTSSPGEAVKATSTQTLLHAHLLLLCGFPFILCYAPAMSMALAWLAERQTSAPLVVAAAWTSLLAGLADAAENALLLALLQPPLRDALVFPIYVVALVKFTLLLFSLGCLGAQLMAAGRRVLSFTAMAIWLALAWTFAAALYSSVR